MMNINSEIHKTGMRIELEHCKQLRDHEQAQRDYRRWKFRHTGPVYRSARGLVSIPEND